MFRERVLLTVTVKILSSYMCYAVVLQNNSEQCNSSTHFDVNRPPDSCNVVTSTQN